jgi:hypothetical protein
MKRIGISSLDKRREDKIPETIVSNQSPFPNSDICNDLEYSLFFVKRESITWVTKSAARTMRILKIISSCLR